MLKRRTLATWAVAVTLSFFLGVVTGIIYSRDHRQTLSKDIQEFSDQFRDLYGDPYVLRDANDVEKRPTQFLTVRFKLGGVDVNARADSGAYMTILDTDLRDVAGRPIRDSWYKGSPDVPIKIYGPIEIKIAGQDILLDNVRVRDVLTADHPFGAASNCILGYDVLRNFAITLNSNSATYLIEKRRVTEKEVEDYLCLPIVLDPKSHRPTVFATSGEFEFAPLIDTGNATHCMLDTESFNAIARRITTYGFPVTTGFDDGSRFFRAGSVDILMLGFAFREQHVSTNLQVLEHNANTIGLPFLLENDAILDFPNGKMYLRRR